MPTMEASREGLVARTSMLLVVAPGAPAAERTAFAVASIIVALCSGLCDVVVAMFNKVQAPNMNVKLHKAQPKVPIKVN